MRALLRHEKSLCIIMRFSKKTKREILTLYGDTQAQRII